MKSRRPPTRPPAPSSPDRLGQALAATLPLDRGGGGVAAFMERFSVEQKAKRKKSNDGSCGRPRREPQRLLGSMVVLSFRPRGTFLLGRNGATSKWA